MALREMPLRYHHAHTLSTESATSTSSFSGASDTSTPPSSAQTHGHNPYRTRSKQPPTVTDASSHKSPPHSPRGGFFRHKLQGDSQTSSSSLGSTTHITVDFGKIESAGATPTQATFDTGVHAAQQSQSWFQRHQPTVRRRHEDDHEEGRVHAEREDDANSDDSFGCGLATAFDKHVGEVLRADGATTALPSAKDGSLAAAWSEKMGQADERQAWLDTVFFQLKARAEGVAEDDVQHIRASGRKVVGTRLQEGVGMERTESSGTTTGAKSQQQGDSFLNFTGLINPCPKPGTTYACKYAKERRELAVPKPSKAADNQAQRTEFSDFVFPPPPPKDDKTLHQGALITTPRPPQMQRFASSDQVLTRGRTVSSSALRQTALANSAASHRSQTHLNVAHAAHAHMDAPTVSDGGQIPPPPPHAAPRILQRQSSRAHLGRERSGSETIKRTRSHGRGGSGGGSGGAADVMVPDLPDWAKRANRSLQQSRQGGGDGNSLHQGGDTVRARPYSPSQLPYNEYLGAEPMARAVSHDTRVSLGRPSLLSRASTNSLRKFRLPEALRVSPSHAQPIGDDMEVSLSSPGSVFTSGGSATSRESCGSTQSGTTCGSSPLTPRSPDSKLGPLPSLPQHHHYGGGHMAPPMPFMPIKEDSAIERNEAPGGVIDLDAEDEHALLLGTGRFALNHGSPVAQTMVAEHQTRHGNGFDFLPSLPKPKFLSPKSSLALKKVPLLKPDELVPIFRQLDFEPASTSGGVDIERSVSASQAPFGMRSRAQLHEDGGRIDQAPTHFTRPRANTFASARTAPPLTSILYSLDGLPSQR